MSEQATDRGYVSPWDAEELEGIARENVPGFDDLDPEQMGWLLRGIRVGSVNPSPAGDRGRGHAS